MKMPKVGDEVRLRFWDHSEGGGDPIELYVYGLVADVSKLRIKLESWTTVDPKAPERTDDRNVARCGILCSCITEVVKLNG